MVLHTSGEVVEGKGAGRSRWDEYFEEDLIQNSEAAAVMDRSGKGRVRVWKVEEDKDIDGGDVCRTWK